MKAIVSHLRAKTGDAVGESPEAWLQEQAFK